MQEGMEENQSLLTFDLRLTEISQESEYCINQIVKNNQDRVAGRGGRWLAVFLFYELLNWKCVYNEVSTLLCIVLYMLLC